MAQSESDQEGALFRCEDCGNEIGPVTMRMTKCLDCGGDMAVAATDGGTDPDPPDSLPKYLREGVQKQDAETLRDLAAYAEQLADHLEAKAERELQERSEGDPEGAPDEWDEADWQDALDEALADVPVGKGTLTTKTIDGRDYYYLQWREGDTVKSQYVAPVTPAEST